MALDVESIVIAMDCMLAFDAASHRIVEPKARLHDPAVLTNAS